MSDWKAQKREIFFNEDTTTIRGKNGSGKSSVYKAFCWLLTGYTDPINVKNHELFDSSLELNQDTPVAIVSAVFDIDGTEVKLERSARATFRRERGTDNYVKAASDTYSFRIDDVEVSATDFNSYIGDKFGNVDILPYMVMGEKFANLANTDKIKARKILESIVGTINVEDVNKRDYSAIIEDIRKYGIDALKERYRNCMKPYKQRLIEIDAIIRVKEEDLRRYEAMNFESIEKERAEVESLLSELENRILCTAKENESKSNQRKQIMEEIHSLSVLLGEKRDAYNMENSKKKSELFDKVINIERENEAIKADNEKAATAYEENSLAIDKITIKLSALNSKRESLIQKRTNVKSLVFDGEYCRFCGAKLQSDKLEEAKAKFSEEKNEKLNDIIMEGLSVRKEIDELSAELQRRTVVKENGFKVEPYKDSEKVKSDYEEFLKNIVPFENTDEYKGLCDKIDELEKTIPSLTETESELIVKRQEANKRFKSLAIQLGEKVAMEKIREQIDSLRIEHNEASCYIIEYEGKIDLVNKFIEERANIVSDRINDKLEECKIVMYSRQKDGELKPDCVIKGIDGIPYATMSNSARVRTCLALQRMLCERFDIELPLFVDEYAIFDSEHAPKCGWQQINLCASDESFRVE